METSGDHVHLAGVGEHAAGLDNGSDGAQIFELKDFAVADARERTGFRIERRFIAGVEFGDERLLGFRAGLLAHGILLKEENILQLDGNAPDVCRAEITRLLRRKRAGRGAGKAVPRYGSNPRGKERKKNGKEDARPTGARFCCLSDYAQQTLKE